MYDSKTDKTTHTYVCMHACGEGNVCSKIEIIREWYFLSMCICLYLYYIYYIGVYAFLKLFLFTSFDKCLFFY